MADPVDLVREACTLLAGYMDTLELEVTEPSSSPFGAADRPPRAADTPEPWNAPAARALMDAHEGVRRLKARLLFEKNGHPGIRHGSSARNTEIVLDAIPKLAAGLSESAEGAALRLVERWISEARRIRAIDEAQLWRPVPQRPCPYCACFFLRVQIDAAGQPAGRVACFGHLPSGEPCRAAWATLAEIARDLERAETCELEG